MKKFFFACALFLTMGFMSCGGPKTVEAEPAVIDTIAVADAVAVDSVAVDSVAVVADTVAVDSVK